MVYVRGHARDFDHWAEQGASGWSYADVLPYFKRMENWHGGDDPEWRGHDGPLHVTRGPRDNPLFGAFIEAGRQAGYPVTDDYNGQSAGRLRPDGGDDLERSPLVRRECLSAPRDEVGRMCRWSAALPAAS